ncbi:MAG: ABC transporter ATP-binding protein [Pseudomonadota bacterium]
MSKTVSIDIKSKTAGVSGQKLEILGEVSTTIDAESFVSIIGPSGCGKSTLLRAIMGLDMDYEGSVRVGDEMVQGAGLDRGIVFQEPRLLPWESVRNNIAFATSRAGHKGASKAEVQGNVDRLIDLFGLTDFADAWPKQLSGGMMQRVALARAMVNLPEVLLMDEPFGALDAHTKTILQGELATIFDAQKTTTILVTHDVEEAVFLSDAILVLSARPGRLLHRVPITLERPRDRASASFSKLRFDILGLAF